MEKTEVTWNEYIAWCGIDEYKLYVEHVFYIFFLEHTFTKGSGDGRNP